MLSYPVVSSVKISINSFLLNLASTKPATFLITANFNILFLNNVSKVFFYASDNIVFIEFCEYPLFSKISNCISTFSNFFFINKLLVILLILMKLSLIFSNELK